MPDESDIKPATPSEGVSGSTTAGAGAIAGAGGAATLGGNSDAAQTTAAAAVATNIVFHTDAIQQVLTDLYGDAGLAGAGTAAQHLGTTEGSDFATAISGIDWSNWHPGDLDSARLVANGGLKDLLDNANVTIRGLQESALQRLGNILANGLNEGLAPHTIAQNMRDIISDPKRADMIARTETARAQGQSSLDSYEANGTEEWDWHANDGACPVCIAYEADSPYPIGGGPAFPAHPNCRCQPLAHIKV